VREAACGAWQLARSRAFRRRDAGPIVRSFVSVSGPSTALGPDGSPSLVVTSTL